MVSFSNSRGGRLIIGINDKSGDINALSSPIDNTEGTGQGTSRGTGLALDYPINQDDSIIIQQSVSTRGTGQNRSFGGIEIVGKSILKFCSTAKSLREIADYLGIKSYKKVKTRYMDKLLSENKLVMTIPDKPTSRFQKYVATK